MNTRLQKALSIILIVGCFVAFGQGERSFELPELRVFKTGPYLGVQRGMYLSGELGIECQWKKIQLKKSKTQGVHTGLNYNPTKNVLGYEAGYWMKTSRIGLTYGANVLLATDFKTTKIGLAPCVGYKLFGFHLQSGYQFLGKTNHIDGYNTFFVRLRFILVNYRDTKMKR
jgi:hypothetical protein